MIGSDQECSFLRLISRHYPRTCEGTKARKRKEKRTIGNRIRDLRSGPTILKNSMVFNIATASLMKVFSEFFQM
jgi:hypothetical protein